MSPPDDALARTQQALDEALQDEYQARATYLAILDRFGPVRPFSNIVASEQRHIDALLTQYDRLGLPVPEDTWPARVQVPETLADACREGVDAEVANAAMYERLFEMTPDPVVLRVFRNLRDASQQRHLPAFMRCVQRGARPGRGRRGAP